METVVRRLDLLRMEGLGLNTREIVTELSEKYHCSPRTIWRDFADRCKWQPSLLHLKDNDKILEKIKNRYEQIYREASFMALQSPNENVRLGALHLKLRATEKMLEAVVIPDLLARLMKIEDEAKRKLKP